MTFHLVFFFFYCSARMLINWIGFFFCQFSDPIFSLYILVRLLWFNIGNYALLLFLPLIRLSYVSKFFIVMNLFHNFIFSSREEKNSQFFPAQKWIAYCSFTHEWWIEWLCVFVGAIKLRHYSCRPVSFINIINSDDLAQFFWGELPVSDQVCSNGCAAVAKK